MLNINTSRWYQALPIELTHRSTQRRASLICFYGKFAIAEDVLYFLKEDSVNSLQFYI